MGTLLPRLVILGAIVAAVPAARAADVTFFETKIRPVLVEHCVKCHTTGGKAKGGLVVDTRAGLLKGGELGPAVVPGKPAASLLLKAMRYSDESLRMPPKAKLPDTVLADFERWIADGAVDPRGEKNPPKAEADAAKAHWAFRPIVRPAIPPVRDGRWSRTTVDRFLLARLEAKGLTPSPEADRRTLIRRVTLDVTGLPPTPEEVEAFVADARKDAYERLVDRLLASPAYGERWGRHWLDVARYADTKDGVLMYGDDRVRPYAYTYRDYVIRALNEDVPFDRFVHDQLAADRIDPIGEPWRLAALGFLTLGRQFDNNVHDILDDRIDTVTRGLLGLTVTCARCHDHKTDPVPMADYYSLYGVFASSEPPVELPLIVPAGSEAAHAAFEKQAAAKQQELRALLDRQYELLTETARQRVSDYLIRVATTKPDLQETAIFFLSLTPEELRPQLVASWRRLIERRGVPDDPVFGPWAELMAVPEGQLAAELPRLLERWRSAPAGTRNPLVVAALVGTKIATRADVARTYGELLRSTWEASRKSPGSVGPDARSLVELLTSTESPAYFPKSRTRDFMSRAEKDAFGGKLQELDRMAVQSSSAPPRAMVLVDTDRPYDPHVFLRGDPSRPGKPVPRQFLGVVAGAGRKPFSTGSGRLDLARAITAADNPLTARVLVNRLWMHHFREPLVDTPSDFGLRTAAPLHLDLLDHLARELIDGGWSLKRLHRQLILSSAYRQASGDRPDCRAADPDNRLLGRMNRRRLDLEAMRDTLLAASGRLDRRMYGRPVDVAGSATEARRTVYGLVDRQSLPGVFRAFDFASPDTSAERRPQTTVPQQALFGLNAPFVAEQARALSRRLPPGPAGERIAALYRLALLRSPSAEEARLATAFVAGGPAAGSRLDRWEQLAQVLLLTNEFQYVD